MHTIDRARLERVVQAARGSARLRMNDNLHAQEDAIHRLLNATEPGTYVQPHRHAKPPKLETLCVLRGRGALITFDDRGGIEEALVLEPSGDCLLAEVPAGAWHTLLALETGTVWFEVKAGPYVPPAPEDLASWAPSPADPQVPAWLARLEREFAGR